jgi:hypothetical protein
MAKQLYGLWRSQPRVSTSFLLTQSGRRAMGRQARLRPYQVRSWLEEQQGFPVLPPVSRGVYLLH